MNKKTILLVDDNPDDVELTRIAIENEAIDCNLMVMSDGAEVIDHFSTIDKQTDEIPDVILLDLKMGKMSGLETLKHLRRHDKTKFIPVAILSSSDEEADIIESYNLGANSYIRKPVDFSEFRETIRILGKYWLMLNQNALKPTG